ncbi:MAG: hypothetical protein QHI48_02545 [Bacteroidota bacterium]|nr:hypothetical protein [Bacteroidota bacterium]
MSLNHCMPGNGKYRVVSTPALVFPALRERSCKTSCRDQQEEEEYAGEGDDEKGFSEADRPRDSFPFAMRSFGP